MDDQNQQRAAPVIKIMISSKSRAQNTRSRKGIQWELATCAYQEDTSRKDQGWALLDGGFMPLLFNKVDLAIADAAAASDGEDKGTCKAPSK
jgi:hypothetical protein